MLRETTRLSGVATAWPGEVGRRLHARHPIPASYSAYIASISDV